MHGHMAAAALPAAAGRMANITKLSTVVKLIEKCEAWKHGSAEFFGQLSFIIPMSGYGQLDGRECIPYDRGHLAHQTSCSTGVCYALELHETGSSWTLEPEIKEKEVEKRFFRNKAEGVLYRGGCPREDRERQV